MKNSLNQAIGTSLQMHEVGASWVEFTMDHVWRITTGKFGKDADNFWVTLDHSIALLNVCTTHKVVCVLKSRQYRFPMRLSACFRFSLVKNSSSSAEQTGNAHEQYLINIFIAQVSMTDSLNKANEQNYTFHRRQSDFKFHVTHCPISTSCKA